MTGGSHEPGRGLKLNLRSLEECDSEDDLPLSGEREPYEVTRNKDIIYNNSRCDQFRKFCTGASPKLLMKDSAQSLDGGVVLNGVSDQLCTRGNATELSN